MRKIKHDEDTIKHNHTEVTWGTAKVLSNPGEKEQSWRYNIRLRQYYKAAVIKTAWYRHKQMIVT